MTKPVDLADFDLSGDEVHKVEYIHPNGTPSGLILHIISEHSRRATNALNALVDARNMEIALAQKEQDAKLRPDVIVRPFESEVMFGRRIAASRIVGWDNAKQPWTPDLALALCQKNAPLANWVSDKSREVGRFFSPPATPSSSTGDPSSSSAE